MKTIKFILAGMFFGFFCVNLDAQTCYELSLNDIKSSLKTKEYNEVLLLVKNTRKYCMDIPEVNALDSIENLAKQKLDSILTAVRPKKVSSPGEWKEALEKMVYDEDKNVQEFKTELVKAYKLKALSDTIITRKVKYDFNRDGLMDIGIIYYIVKKEANNVTRILSITVLKQNKEKKYIWNNKDLNTYPNVLTSGCEFTEGLDHFSCLENGAFIFLDKNNTCKTVYVYEDKTSTVKLK